MKETTELLKFVLRVAEKIEAGLADDGKLSWAEMAALLPDMTALPGALEGFKEIGSELKEMDEAAKLELYMVIDSLKLTDPKKEAIAEEALKVSLSVYKLIELIKDAKK
jgi:hypothetical protein